MLLPYQKSTQEDLTPSQLRTLKNLVKEWLGPIQDDIPCYITLDLEPGPKGEEHALYISNLRVAELRRVDETESP